MGVAGLVDSLEVRQDPIVEENSSTEWYTWYGSLGGTSGAEWAAVLLYDEIDATAFGSSPMQC